MAELIKIENDKHFKELYEGVNGDKKVYVILDDNCVRYVVLKHSYKRGVYDFREVRRSEFKNDQKEKCFKNALKVLNK